MGCIAQTEPELTGAFDNSPLSTFTSVRSVLNNDGFFFAVANAEKQAKFIAIEMSYKIGGVYKKSLVKTMIKLHQAGKIAFAPPNSDLTILTTIATKAVENIYGMLAAGRRNILLGISSVLGKLGWKYVSDLTMSQGMKIWDAYFDVDYGHVAWSCSPKNTTSR